jgi:DNA end-binding protein Ku
MAARSPRPIWSGSISFGLVNVPVRLFSATSHSELRFNQLHDADGGRIREKRVCEVDGKEVPYEHIIKGYAISKGQYVAVTKEELAGFAPKASKTIDIEDFVALREIDPMYFDTTYYLVPDHGAGKAYGLLLEAMEKTGMVGIARVVLRTKQYLCAVRPLEKAMALSTMHYADEVIGTADLDGLPERAAHPSERELTMATKLVQSLSGPFKPEQYRDTYRDQVMEMIEKKARGEQILTQEEEPAPAHTRNLADALEASLQSVAQRGKTRGHAHNEEPDHAEPEHQGERRHRAAPAHKKAARSKK